MKKRKIILLIIFVMIILVIFFFPKTSSYMGGDVYTKCNCFGITKNIYTHYNVDPVDYTIPYIYNLSSGVDSICYGIPINCKKNYFSNRPIEL